MSEVAVPGRTAHEGKPASNDTSVPSPPHPPEGAGTLGRYSCGLDQRRRPHPRRRPAAVAFFADAMNDPHWPSVKEILRQAELAVGHPPPPTGHEPLGGTVSADIAITGFEPDIHAGPVTGR